mmetsp:Transcript_18979/g.57380  ORF Transcript_18979/g.57380 Transcript_18979/m.57380 type:complete len:257 (-) Transcript_18979:763-1533(-)
MATAAASTLAEWQCQATPSSTTCRASAPPYASCAARSAGWSAGILQVWQKTGWRAQPRARAARTQARGPHGQLRSRSPTRRASCAQRLRRRPPWDHSGGSTSRVLRTRAKPIGYGRPSGRGTRRVGGTAVWLTCTGQMRGAMSSSVMSVATQGHRVEAMGPRRCPRTPTWAAHPWRRVKGSRMRRERTAGAMFCGRRKWLPTAVTMHSATFSRRMAGARGISRNYKWNLTSSPLLTSVWRWATVMAQGVRPTPRNA